jgi:hypothetical protein
VEKAITSNLFIKLNFKVYYLFNEVDNKKLILLPFINFKFRLNKTSKLPPVIYNPRL